MAQTNFTPILTYKSDTASAVPSAGNLTNSANGAELAVNTADKRLFTKDSGGNVVELGTNPSSLTLPNSTANGVVYANGSKVLTTGSALTFDGTDLATTGGVRLNNSQYYYGKNAAGSAVRLMGINSGNVNYIGAIDSGPTDAIYGAASTFTNQAWYVGGSEQMRLTSTGLGIGTSSPGTKLDVRGTIQSVASGAGLSAISSSTFYYMNVSSTGLDTYTDANASAPMLFKTGGTERMRLDSSGNLGLGVTPSAWGGGYKALQVGLYSGLAYEGGKTLVTTNAYNNGTNWLYGASDYAARYQQQGGQHQWYTAPSGTAGNAISFSQVMTLDASGNLLVGTTSQAAGLGFSASAISGAYGPVFKSTGGTGFEAADFWNITTTGDNVFCYFRTEGGGTVRGSVQYNRGAGLTAYNTTSDYRAKDIIGPLTDSGAVIDSVPVYMGKMKGATQERPMFIAHEVPAYAHTGEKDAVDADGNPVYQQMDASALVPVMWAEIQSLRKRLAAAGI